MSRRLNGRIPGTQRTFRYPAPSLRIAHVSELDQERVSALVKTVPAKNDPQSTSPAHPEPTQDSATAKAYAIIKQPPVTTRRPPNAPPKVVSHKELLNRTQGVQCYDAVPVNEPEDTQAEVEKFIPMLEEYLKRTLKTVSRVAHTINICYFSSSLCTSIQCRTSSQQRRVHRPQTTTSGTFSSTELRSPRTGTRSLRISEHCTCCSTVYTIANPPLLKYRAPRFLWRPG